ncbi:hypothetical protein DVH24_042347 [Malus domestica]|uniref:Uncharacterized protein n=1 Tax=Malus domestica TaxID=3750 RepID=A0A498IYY0_MALDO|nr:hypothetical protein DVH24_042347 [Malus domestica]
MSVDLLQFIRSDGRKLKRCVRICTFDSFSNAEQLSYCEVALLEICALGREEGSDGSTISKINIIIE